MQRYEPKKIEPKWRQVWQETGLYKTSSYPGKDKYYCLVMFPYPSGNLHVGHWYNFGPGDVVARFNRMLGKEILHPIGFDAFGLPAENAAIQRNIPPAQWTDQNIEYMTKQLETIGTMYDWDKMVNTSKPEYYKWTQWIFLKLYENGLAYRKKGWQNWCPKDQTVLANEQVVGEDNHCDRCGTPVEKKELEQWFFKITDYAERLLGDLEGIDWPERVKTMQENWIGKSVGAEVEFAIANSAKSNKQKAKSDTIKVFTTRPDTLFGASFMVLAPEHPLVDELTVSEQKSAVEDYVKQAAGKTELERKEGENEKTGIFAGSYAINPANGEEIPIWIGDFVLAGYGTGAIFGDIHDERDFDFAKKYDIPARVTVLPEDKAEAEQVKNKEYSFTGEGILVDSGEFSGMRSSEAREKITAWLEEKNAGVEKVNYRLRDWLISRQRYWGAPIPVIYCSNSQCLAEARSPTSPRLRGAGKNTFDKLSTGQEASDSLAITTIDGKEHAIIPVPEKDLPVELPLDVEFAPTGRSPLEERPDFYQTDCPDCGKPARRETDTMDTFVDSSWYFLRYPNNRYESGPFDPEAVKKWMPVDHYIGGIEHAILHLLYARFITKVLHDHAGLPFTEPFKKLSNQGIILGPDGNKMSKSKGNVVDPDEQVDAYGTDTLRLYLMFMGPYDQGGPYNFGAIAGVRRFIEKVWTLAQGFIDAEGKPAVTAENAGEKTTELATQINKTVKAVTEDLQELGFNTTIAKMMQLTNSMIRLSGELPFNAARAEWKDALETTLRLLAPLAPHFTEELWQQLGNDKSIHLSGWPSWDEELTKDAMITVVVQVNGRLRDSVLLVSGVSKEEMIEAARGSDKAGKYLEGKEVIKTITVPGKLVNFVVRD